MELLTLRNCVLVVKKQHGFVAYSATNRMRPSTKKKSKICGILFIWILPLSHDGSWRALWRTCHLMEAELSDRLFLYFFIFQHFLYMCECVLCWMCLYLHDYHLFERKSARYYCVITAINVNAIYMNRVWFIDFMAHLYDYHLYNWPSAHQHVFSL